MPLSMNCDRPDLCRAATSNWIAPDGFNLSDEQIVQLTEKLVRAKPDAFVSGTAVGTRAAQQATQTIPIVAMSEDMLTEGLVNSMARPSGNTTGISIMSPGLDGK